MTKITIDSRPEITVPSQLGVVVKKGFPKEVTELRQEGSEGASWEEEGGKEKSKCKDPGAGTSW